MSTESNLPPELAGFESQLRGQPLPASKVDRDELMYEAGWAAAEAQRSGWFWPTTSGVLAASVMLLAVLLVRRPSEEGVVAQVGSPASVVQEEVVSKDGATGVVRVEIQVPLRRHTAPLLVMRERALRMEFDEPVAAVLSTEDEAKATITARELLQEFLPAVRSTRFETYQRVFQSTHGETS